MFTLPFEGYAFDAEDSSGAAQCIIAVNHVSDSSGLYILGDPFLRTFTTTFDYKNGKMEVGINTNAPAGTKIEKKLSTWVIFGIVVAAFILVAIIGVAIFYFYKRCRRNTVEYRRGSYREVWSGKGTKIGGSEDAKVLINKDEEITQDTEPNF